MFRAFASAKVMGEDPHLLCPKSSVLLYSMYSGHISLGVVATLGCKMVFLPTALASVPISWYVFCLASVSCSTNTGAWGLHSQLTHLCSASCIPLN